MRKVLFLLCFLTSIIAYAYDFVVDGIAYDVVDFSASPKTCEVANIHTVGADDSRYSSSLIVPSVVSFNGVDYKVIGTGKECFYGAYCPSVTLSEGLEYIGFKSFHSYIKSVTLPQSITDISEYAFCDASDITEITVPSAITKINTMTFAHCKKLVKVVLPNNIKSLENGAFYYCWELRDINIPTSCTLLDQSAFNTCKSLESIDLTNTKVVSIGDYCFGDCYSLRSIDFPPTLSSIGSGAFRNAALTSINIPSSVKSIGKNAFQGCNNLDLVYCTSTTPPSIDDAAFDSHTYLFGKLIVPDESIEAYRNAPGWSNFANLRSSSDEPVLPICEIPNITLVDGRLSVESPTKGSECVTNIYCQDAGSYSTSSISLSGSYIIRAHATADGFSPSNVREVILLWYNPSVQNSSIESLIADTSKPILISSSSGTIYIDYVDAGTSIEVYTLSGNLFTSEIASSSSIRFNCPNGIYIIKVGEQSAKVLVK